MTDRADQLVVLEHRHGKQRPYAGKFDAGDDEWIALDVGLLSHHVGDVDHLLRCSDATKAASRSRTEWRIGCVHRHRQAARCALQAAWNASPS